MKGLLYVFVSCNQVELVDYILLNIMFSEKNVSSGGWPEVLGDNGRRPSQAWWFDGS